MWRRRRLTDEALQGLALAAFQRAGRTHGYCGQERLIELCYEMAGPERLGRGDRRRLAQLTAGYASLLERGRLI